MSSHLYEKGLNLKLHTSRIYKTVLVILYLAVTFCVLIIIPVTHPVLLLVIPVLSYSAYYYFKRYIFLSADNSVISVSHTISGDWLLGLRNNEALYVELGNDSYIHPLLVILNFKVVGRYRRISVLLFNDACDEKQHRELRCRLKLSRPAEQEKLLRR